MQLQNWQSDAGFSKEFNENLKICFKKLKSGSDFLTHRITSSPYLLSGELVIDDTGNIEGKVLNWTQNEVN